MLPASRVIVADGRDAWITFSALFEEDLLEALQPENCVAARTSYGGPAFSENAKQFSRGDVLLAEQQVVLDALKARI